MQEVLLIEGDLMLIKSNGVVSIGDMIEMLSDVIEDACEIFSFFEDEGEASDSCPISSVEIGKMTPSLLKNCDTNVLGRSWFKRQGKTPAQKPKKAETRRARQLHAEHGKSMILAATA